MKAENKNDFVDLFEVMLVALAFVIILTLLSHIFG